MKFSFKDNQVVKDINTVPEDFRGLYVKQDDDTYKLDSDNAGVKSAVAAIVRLSETLTTVRGEVKTAQEAAKAAGAKVDLSALSDFGDDPTKILEAFNAKLTEAQEAAKAAGAGDMERQIAKIKEDLAKGHTKDLEGRDARITGLSGQLHDLLVNTAATKALAEAKGEVELLMPFVSKHIKVEEADGKFNVSVVDTAGDTRYSGATGAPMSIPELVSEMKGNEKYGKLFASDSPNGPGGPPGGRPSDHPGARKNEGDKSAVDKIAAGLAAGKYKRGQAA